VEKVEAKTLRTNPEQSMQRRPVPPMQWGVPIQGSMEARRRASTTDRGGAVGSRGLAGGPPQAGRSRMSAQSQTPPAEAKRTLPARRPSMVWLASPYGSALMVTL